MHAIPNNKQKTQKHHLRSAILRNPGAIVHWCHSFMKVLKQNLFQGARAAKFIINLPTRKKHRREAMKDHEVT